MIDKVSSGDKITAVKANEIINAVNRPGLGDPSYSLDFVCTNKGQIFNSNKDNTLGELKFSRIFDVMPITIRPAEYGNYPWLNGSDEEAIDTIGINLGAKLDTLKMAIGTNFGFSGIGIIHIGYFVGGEQQGDFITIGDEIVLETEDGCNTGFVSTGIRFKEPYIEDYNPLFIYAFSYHSAEDNTDDLNDMRYIITNVRPYAGFQTLGTNYNIHSDGFAVERAVAEKLFNTEENKVICLGVTPLIDYADNHSTWGGGGTWFSNPMKGVVEPERLGDSQVKEDYHKSLETRVYQDPEAQTPGEYARYNSIYAWDDAGRHIKHFPEEQEERKKLLVLVREGEYEEGEEPLPDKYGEMKYMPLWDPSQTDTEGSALKQCSISKTEISSEHYLQLYGFDDLNPEETECKTIALQYDGVTDVENLQVVVNNENNSKKIDYLKYRFSLPPLPDDGIPDTIATGGDQCSIDRTEDQYLQLYNFDQAGPGAPEIQIDLDTAVQGAGSEGPVNPVSLSNVFVVVKSDGGRKYLDYVQYAIKPTSPATIEAELLSTLDERYWLIDYNYKFCKGGSIGDTTGNKKIDLNECQLLGYDKLSASGTDTGWTVANSLQVNGNLYVCGEKSEFKKLTIKDLEVSQKITANNMQVTNLDAGNIDAGVIDVDSLNVDTLVATSVVDFENVDLACRTLYCNETATFKQGLTVTESEAPVNIQGNLQVLGVSEFNDVTVGGCLDIQGTISSDIWLDGNLTCNSDAYFYKPVTCESLSVKNDLGVDGNVNVTGDLTVNGTMEFNKLEIKQDVAVGGELSVNSDTYIDGLLDVGDTVQTDGLDVDGDAFVDGTLEAHALESRSTVKVFESLQIGNTTLNESQLQALLGLLNRD